MKRTILSAAAICAIAVGFVLPSTSFAATRMAHGDQPGWYQSNIGNTNNGANSSDSGAGSSDSGVLNGNIDRNNGPWTGDHYNYDPGQGR